MNATGEFIGAYPSGWIWPYGNFDLIKCLIPFFDGLAIFMPSGLIDETLDGDPYLAQPLFELGYLRNYNPDDVLDSQLSHRVVETLKKFMKDESFKKVGANLPFQDRSISHLGARTNPKEVAKLLRYLERSGLAKVVDNRDVFKVRSDIFDSIMRTCFSAVSLALRQSGTDLVPVLAEEGSGGRYASELLWGTNTFSLPSFIEDEIADVGVDLRVVPLDEIMDFRSKYSEQHRAYMRGLRDAARAFQEISVTYTTKGVKPSLGLNNFDEIARERIEEIRDQASSLRSISRSAFRRRSLSLTIGLASSAWALRTGDDVSAALGAAATAAGLLSDPPQQTKYSYLFTLHELQK